MILCAILLLVCFGCTTKESGQLTPQQIDQIKKEVRATFDACMARWQKVDFDGAFKYYSSDFVGYGSDGNRFDANMYKEMAADFFNLATAYKLTIYRFDILAATENIGVISIDGKDEIFLKSGDKMTWDPAHYTYGFRKITGQWKIYYLHSTATPTKKADQK
jgi:ketosteroid isomerase-like protein